MPGRKLLVGSSHALSTVALPVVKRLPWAAAGRVLLAAARAARTGAGTTGPTGRRRLSYTPQADGTADPGEVVWAQVAFEEDAGRRKDRPVLVVGRAGPRTVHALMLSSQSHRAGDANWLPLGRGAWDSRRRPSFVRLDRVLELPEDGLRREGAVLGRHQFAQVSAQLRARYGWE